MNSAQHSRPRRIPAITSRTPSGTGSRRLRAPIRGTTTANGGDDQNSVERNRGRGIDLLGLQAGAGAALHLAAARPELVRRLVLISLPTADPLPTVKQQALVLRTRMEGGELSLDESLKSFERGIGLYRHCQTALEQAELRVRLLLDPEAPETAEPFDSHID